MGLVGSFLTFEVDLSVAGSEPVPIIIIIIITTTTATIIVVAFNNISGNTGQHLIGHDPDPVDRMTGRDQILR